MKRTVSIYAHDIQKQSLFIVFLKKFEKSRRKKMLKQHQAVVGQFQMEAQSRGLGTIE
jgi:hypothetical protein